MIERSPLIMVPMPSWDRGRRGRKYVDGISLPRFFGLRAAKDLSRQQIVPNSSS
jgi:hypothetical protein